MRSRGLVENFVFLTFPIRPLVEDVVFVFGTLFGQGRLLKPFDLVEVLGELAFAVGNISELVYLFEEHLQFDPDEETPVLHLKDLRGFYEGLSRYIQGLGAHDDAEQLKRTFVAFLVACGENELADYYRAMRTLGASENAEMTLPDPPEYEQLT